MNHPGSQKTQAEWVAHLKEHFLLPDVDEETAKALFAYLTDLELWTPEGRDYWAMGSDDLGKELRSLSGSERGFALKYFLRDPSISAEIGEGEPSGERETKNVSTGNPELLERKTSNLSNLQIVKKYGRQMESFIDLEKQLTEKLTGKNTTRIDARKLFNFILTKMKAREKPRAWEQLSRRRHK